MMVRDDMVVSLDYTLRLEDGEVVETTDEDGPVEFIQGHGQVISGLEERLYGMQVGDEREMVIGAEDGYGEYDPEAMEVVPRDAFPADFELTEGAPLELVDEDSDEVVEGYISEIRPDDIVIDLNHPLAGETLFFHVKVAALREATAEELEHGHVHGSEGHID